MAGVQKGVTLIFRFLQKGRKYSVFFIYYTFYKENLRYFLVAPRTHVFQKCQLIFYIIS